MNDRGFRILAALDAVASRTGAEHAEIARAWPLASRALRRPSPQHPTPFRPRASAAPPISSSRERIWQTWPLRGS